MLLYIKRQPLKKKIGIGDFRRGQPNYLYLSMRAHILKTTPKIMLYNVLNLSSTMLSGIILYPKMLATTVGSHPNSLI